MTASTIEFNDGDILCWEAGEWGYDASSLVDTSGNRFFGIVPHSAVNGFWMHYLVWSVCCVWVVLKGQISSFRCDRLVLEYPFLELLVTCLGEYDILGWLYKCVAF